MARARSPDRDRAFEMWCNSDGKMKLKDIAETLGVSDSKIRKWKSMDKWDEQLNGTLHNTKGSAPHEKRERSNKGGAPKGNQNAKGNRGGPPLGSKNATGHGAPHFNSNAVTHGLYWNVTREHLSEEDQQLFDLAAEISGLDNELQVARFKLARLIREQQLRNMQGTEVTKEGFTVVYKLTDDFYEGAIDKVLSIIAKLERDIERKQLEQEKLQIEKERLEVYRQQNAPSKANEATENWVDSLHQIAARRRKLKEGGDNE